MKKKIEYSFITLPINYIYIMDADCLKLFSILLQKHSFWYSKNLLEDGYFVKSVEELARELEMKNIKDIRCTIQALVNAELIDVVAEDGKRKTARFKLNTEKINEIASENLFELKERNYYIHKLSRTEPITYYQQNDNKMLTKCTPTINKKDKLNNINNNSNINNIKENNILEKKEENKEYFNKEFFKLLEEKDKEIENKKRKKSEITWKGDKVDDEPLTEYEKYLFSRAESSSIF